MHFSSANRNLVRQHRARSRGFTLIELLTVIAIISLLIGILVPSVSKARDSAKNAKTRAIMKNMGDGLELFVNENSAELRGQNYPSSTAGDDPTESGLNSGLSAADMSGAQWVVRYLMGKKLDGYVARRVVPPEFATINANAGEEQLHWYDSPGDSGYPTDLTEPLPRGGPYLEPGAVKLKPPKNIVGSPVAVSDATPRYNNPVIVDSFEMPILYYAANSLQAARAGANITTYPNDPNNPDGIYNYADNALFTGHLTEGGTADPAMWNFGSGLHKLTYGPSNWTTAPGDMRTEISTHSSSFAYYILNKEAWESSNSDPTKRTLVPNRKDQYILVSPGKDGLFGTGDDVMNF
jgi:prepilin-type N-terminal cleavage/methylation domain-containing protein